MYMMHFFKIFLIIYFMRSKKRCVADAICKLKKYISRLFDDNTKNNSFILVRILYYD